jgi:type 2 lantibiotic biosynthesis protein LanM
LERSSHAWTEKIYVRPCANGEPARRYFERAGMMAAVLYALEAVDCTQANILADGEDPVLIDTEALLQPRPRVDEGDPWKALSAAGKALFYDSVLRLYILPRWIPQPGGEKLDVSGLGLGSGNRGAVKRKIWKHINTDEMLLTWEKGQFGAGGVAQQSEPVQASDYVNEIIAGFEAMYRQLIEKRQKLCAEDGPLVSMRGFATRIIVRNTQIYFGLLERCLAPQYLKYGMDASICVDVLTQLFADSEDKPRAWPMIAAEQAALLDLNIPRFDSPVETDALRIGTDRYIPNYFTEPALSLFDKRFRQLSEIDLDLQKRYIRCSFGLMAATQGSAANSSGTRMVAETTDTDAFLGRALSIAEAISSHAICAADGTASWITQAYDPDCQFWQVHPVGLFLYDGICGIALFLAALERITGERRHRKLIDGALKVIQRLSSRARQYHLERRSVGAGLGTASIAYSLANIGLLLEDDAVLQESTKLTRLITRDHVFADRRLDLLSGTAGCLLVLHSLYRLNPKPWILDLSVDCGEHLLASRSASSTGLMTWRTVQGQSLAGFSHGAAGITLALSRLYELTSDERYRRAVQQAIEYENSLFSEEAKNWPNLLAPARNGSFAFWNSWCHGAPGIGLARLGSRSCLDPDAYNRDLAVALEKAGEQQLTNVDGLCCGNLGRIELLIEASSHLGRPDLLSHARQIGSSVLHRADSNGQFMVGIPNGIYVASFHQGMAGVGYQLLRLAKPDQVPSVLSWN